MCSSPRGSVSKTEFLLDFARVSGMPMERIENLMDAVPCPCGSSWCGGWRIVLKRGLRISSREPEGFPELLRKQEIQ